MAQAMINQIAPIKISKEQIINNYTSIGRKPTLKWLVGQFDLATYHRRTIQRCGEKVIDEYTHNTRRKITMDRTFLDECLVLSPKYSQKLKKKTPHKTVDYCEHELTCDKLVLELKATQSKLSDSLKSNEEVIKMKRRHNHYNRLKTKNNSLNKENKMLLKKQTDMQKRLLMKNIELKRLRAREQYSSTKVKQLKSTSLLTDVVQLKTAKANLEKELLFVQNEFATCKEKVNELQKILFEYEQDTVKLFKNNKYTDRARKCIFELLAFDVSASKIGLVIESVLRNLLNKFPNKIPCRNTVLSMNIERLALVQIQLGDVFADKTNTTLLTDETSKFGSKCMGYEASDTDGANSMDKKRKKSYYIKSAYAKKSKISHTLEAGMRGYFITCNKMEKEATREGYSLLNEYADTLYGAEQPEATSDSDCEDIEKAMEKEVQALKEQQKSTTRRFQAVNTGASNCIFISTTLPDPTPIADLILEELHRTKSSKSRHVMKFFPVVGSCKTDLDKIRMFALDMVEAHFKGMTEFTYCLEIKIRNNADLKKGDVMRAMTQAVSDLKPLARVKLNDPQYVVSINVIKRVLCFSVLKHFVKYRKYNLQQIVTVNDEVPDKNDRTQDKSDEVPDKSDEVPDKSDRAKSDSQNGEENSATETLSGTEANRTDVQTDKSRDG